jgi:hypothetical protein
MRTKLILLFLLGAIWIFPITRWFHTMSQVMKVDAEEQSINSHNDVRWNVMVGSIYLIAAFATIAAIFFLKRGIPITWLGVITGICVAGLFNIFPCDGVIVLFANPLFPAFLGLCVIGCVVISLIVGHRVSTKISKE